MRVTTSKGKTLEIDWMYPQRNITEQLMIGLHDNRPFAEIAEDFAGCDHFHRQSEEEGDMDCDGYTELIIIARPSYGMDDGYVLVTLSRPAKE